MKLWMVLLAMTGWLAGCSNFEWEDSFPTVLLGVGDVGTTRKTVTIGEKDYQEYTLEFDVSFTALPGSPEGIIRYLTTTSDQILVAGVFIPNKPATSPLCDSKGDCQTRVVRYKLLYPLDVPPSELIIASYTAESVTGKVRTFELGTPQPVFVPLPLP